MNQTGVLSSAWRYRLLVGAIVLVFGVAAGSLSLSRADTHVAEATVVLEDPQAASVLAINPSESSSRSIANQLEVFRSGLVSSKASEIATENGYEVSTSDLATNTEFETLGGTDVITVLYTDSDPERAEAVANSIIEAYDQVQLDQRRSANTSILERLDITEELLVSNLDAIQAQIDLILAVRDTESQIAETLNRVSEVQAQILQATNDEARADLIDQLADLQDQMQALQLAAEIEAGSSTLAPLLEDKERLDAQLTAIDDRRTEIQLDSAIEGSGIAFFSPASITEVPSGAGPTFSILAGLILGAMAALGVAYAMGSRRREFIEASEPEATLAAPFLAEIPRWAGASKVPVPVRDDPRSLTAEAFRFAYASIEIRISQSDIKTLNFVSANVGEGKSTLVTNTAWAAARTGKRVLLIDADFGNQGASKLLLVDDWLQPGITDLVLGDTILDDAVTTVTSTEGAGELEVMGRGTVEVTAPDFFANSKVADLMETVADVYDLVLIDGPPLLQVAYASTIARLADGLVLVVPHETRIRDAEKFASRVQLMSTEVLGYLYNLAPRTAGHQPLGGSMKDVLGDRTRNLPTTGSSVR